MLCAGLLFACATQALPPWTEAAPDLCPGSATPAVSSLEGEGVPSFISLSCLEDRDQPHGPMITWHADSWYLSTLAFARHGVPHGPSFQWREDGSLWLRGNLLGGQSDGNWFTYFSDGEIETQSTYRKDVFDGAYRRWSEEGNLLEEGEYVDGVRHGTWYVLDEETGESSARYYHWGEEL